MVRDDDRAVDFRLWRHYRQEALAELLQDDPTLPVSVAARWLGVPPNTALRWAHGVRPRRLIDNLDDGDLERLRESWEAGVYGIDLAREYGFTDVAIGAYARRHCWDSSRRDGIFGNPRRP